MNYSYYNIIITLYYYYIIVIVIGNSIQKTEAKFNSWLKLWLKTQRNSNLKI